MNILAWRVKFEFKKDRCKRGGKKEEKALTTIFMYVVDY
jgi:hypothetical protein